MRLLKTHIFVDWDWDETPSLDYPLIALESRPCAWTAAAWHGGEQPRGERGQAEFNPRQRGLDIQRSRSRC